MKQFIFIISFLFLSICIKAQTAKLTGKITAENNKPVAAATITIIGQKGGTTTNADGEFTLGLIVGKKYIIEITAVGFATKRLEDVEVKNNQPNDIYILLETKSTKLTDVTVKSSSAKKETVNALISYQRNTNTVAQVISAEAIKRSPDKNTGEILKRVPGTSVQDGKYLIVRGLADRYNQAMLNGILLSSTEPDRKTFSFDIFPAATIDNIIMNKAFVPELPGEWAGGLVQVNTKDVPTSNFLNVQIGTGFNTQTIGNDFYTYKGGKLDFVGFDDGTRALPNGLPLKSDFNNLTQDTKTEYGKLFSNTWSTSANSSNILPALNRSLQLSWGCSKNVGKQNKLGAIIALNYSNSFRRSQYENRLYSIVGGSASTNFDYYNNKYSNDVLWGGLANFTLQLGSKHKISFKNIFNVNATDYTTKRTGKDFENDPVNGENIRATELAFKANTFYNGQLSGDHNFPRLKAKLHWNGSFNILDQYIPDQRRIQYNQNIIVPNSPYLLLVSASKTSQRSGSRYFGMLSDYIYTTGADVAKSFTLWGQAQTFKGGYMLQIKDRLFDSRPFAIYIPTGSNTSLQMQNEETVFSATNFGNGFDNKFAFNEIYGSQFRYMANTILNAGFIQFDNQFNKQLKITWGLRWENFDQLVGSPKKSDPRHVYSNVDDFLPGVNITYKLNDKTNLRLSGSQTVIRPEFRELSPFAFYDFDLGATVTGNPSLLRTKVTNLDLRYELYSRPGELFTAGVFYKYFQNPIELYFNQSGAGSSSTFNYINAEKATGYGIEIEFRKKLDFTTALKNFTVHGNLSYIYNRVQSNNTNLDRPMQGQSPYLINLGIQYDVEKLGLSTTVLFNQIGRRIFYVGGSDFPPVWENPRQLVDVQIAKKVLKKKGEIRLNISDLLNQQAYFYHDLNNNKKYDKNGGDAFAIGRKYGTNINITFAYTIK